MTTASGGQHGSSSFWALPISKNFSHDDENIMNKKPPPPPGSSSNSPTATTPAIAASKRRRNGSSKDSKTMESNDSKESDSDHEIHVWTERERRKKMRNMFASLHALLPHLPSKADKSTIVDEAVNFIKTLQHSLQMLQNQKLERIRGAPMADYDVPMLLPTQTVAIDQSRDSFMEDKGFSKNWGMANPTSPTFSFPCFYHCFQTWSSPNVILSVSGDDAHISVCASRTPGLLVAIFYILEKHKLEVITAQISSDNFRSMYMIHAHASSKDAGQQFPEAMAMDERYKLAVGEIISCLSS